MPPPRPWCQVKGDYLNAECAELATWYYRAHSDHAGKMVTLWACDSCADWWETRHPEAVRQASQF